MTDIDYSIFFNKDVTAYLTSTFPNLKNLKEILKQIILPSNFYSLRLNLSKTSLDEFQDEILKEEFLSINIEDYPIKLDNLVFLPVKGPNSIELEEKMVFCDKFASESIRIGADLFVPGVKQIPNSIGLGDKVSILFNPEKSTFLSSINHFKSDLGDKISSNNINTHFHVANGIAEMSSTQWTKSQSGIFIKNTQPRYIIPNYRNTPYYLQGIISEQSFPPIFAMNLFANFILKQNPDYPNTNNFNPVIFDTCAAPGHKTCALSESLFHYSKGKNHNMQPKWFKISAIDRSKNRLFHLENDTKRLGLEKIEIINVNLSKIEKQYPEFLEFADYLLFDPPCSALGQKPKLFVEKKIDQLLDYAKNQRRLLKIVDRLIKPGGYLMFNTCTFAKEENEGTVLYALEKLNYKTINISKGYKNLVSPGIQFKTIEKFCSLDDLIRFYPNKTMGSGYFIALLQKSK